MEKKDEYWGGIMGMVTNHACRAFQPVVPEGEKKDPLPEAEGETRELIFGLFFKLWGGILDDMKILEFRTFQISSRAVWVQNVRKTAF